MQCMMIPLNFVGSPLFQVYVLGHNLQRPFATPANPLENLQKQFQEASNKTTQDVIKNEGDKKNE